MGHIYTLPELKAILSPENIPKLQRELQAAVKKASMDPA